MSLLYDDKQFDIKLSQQSGIAPFETLFNNFQIQATPFYNFWEETEETINGEPQGFRDLNDIPRYIQLKWKQAPDIPDPDQSRKDKLKGQDPNSRLVFTQLSPFGFGSYQIVSSAQNGILMLPAHMQPENFESNAQNLANGFVFSGIIQASSETGQPPAGAGMPQYTQRAFDVDAYLADSDNAGITPSALESAQACWDSITLGLKYLSEEIGKLSPDAALQYGYLFQGQFGVAAPSNGAINIRGSNPGSPGLSDNIRVVNEGGRGDHPHPTPGPQPSTTTAGEDNTVDNSNTGVNGVSDPNAGVGDLNGSNPKEFNWNTHYMNGDPNMLGGGPTPSAVEPPDAPPVRMSDPVIPMVVQVKLIHTNVGNLFSDDHVNSAWTPEHAEAVASLVPFAGNLVALSAAGLQNYRRNAIIPGNPVLKDLVKPLEYIGYILQKFEQQNGSFVHVKTFYIPGREYDCFNDCEVRYGVSYRYRIRSVLRWSRANNVGMLGTDSITPPINSTTTAPTSMTTNLVSYFGSEFSKNWTTANVLDSDNPYPPDEFTVRPISNFRDEDNPSPVQAPAVEVTCKIPYNPQRDIYKIEIYKKIVNNTDGTSNGWFKVYSTGNTSPLRNVYFLDTDVKFKNIQNVSYVYTARCIAKHNQKSKLSDQLAVTLNGEWRKNGEFDVEFVSCEGVDLDYDSGPFSTYPPQRTRHEITFNTNYDGEHHVWQQGEILLMGRQCIAASSISDNHYIARIESLDNGQHFDVPVNIAITNTAPRQITG